jgi:hypothetical protein
VRATDVVDDVVLSEELGLSFDVFFDESSERKPGE